MVKSKRKNFPISYKILSQIKSKQQFIADDNKPRLLKKSSNPKNGYKMFIIGRIFFFVFLLKTLAFTRTNDDDNNVVVKALKQFYCTFLRNERTLHIYSRSKNSMRSNRQERNRGEKTKQH